MTIEGEIREFIKSGRLMSFSGTLSSKFEAISDIGFANELMFTQEPPDGYQCWLDLTELWSSSSYCDPRSNQPNNPYYLVGAWISGWEVRNFQPFNDEVVGALSRIIQSSRVFTPLEGTWENVYEAYLEGGLPCGIRNDGTITVLWKPGWPKVELVELTPIQKKRKEIDRKRALARIEDLEGLH